MPLRRKALDDAADLAYRRVVAQARRPEFFAVLEVPDTLDGRFELICLHAGLFLRRIKGEAAPAAALGQRFYDTMFDDFDRSLREIGTGDLSVGRQIRRMAEGFYGRIKAYEDGLDGGDAVLEAALSRNLFGTAPADPGRVGSIAAYVRREAAQLAGQPAAALLAGNVVFGDP